MLGDMTSEGSTMFTNKGAGSRFKPLQGRGDVQGRLHGKEGMWTDGWNKMHRTEGLWCSHCKRPRHTRETCFKLHGKEAVLQKLGGFKNMTSRNQVYSSNRQEEPVEKTEPTPELEQNQLKADEISKLADEVSKLKMFLKTLQDGSCSIAQQGNQPGNSFHLSSLTTSLKPIRMIYGFQIQELQIICPLIQMFLIPISLL